MGFHFRYSVRGLRARLCAGRAAMRLHPACPVRGWVFEREEGYWTGGVAIDPVATELPARLARSPRPRRVAR